MTAQTVEYTGKRKRNWAPYILLAPSLLFLVFFFATPMANVTASQRRLNSMVSRSRLEKPSERVPGALKPSI